MKREKEEHSRFGGKGGKKGKAGSSIRITPEGEGKNRRALRRKRRTPEHFS